ncbi:MAG: hypothetical protein ABIR60_03780, partial [Allosphingosinicella sp.]
SRIISNAVQASAINLVSRQYHSGHRSQSAVVEFRLTCATRLLSLKARANASWLRLRRIAVRPPPVWHAWRNRRD